MAYEDQPHEKAQGESSAPQPATEAPDPKQSADALQESAVGQGEHQHDASDELRACQEELEQYRSKLEACAKRESELNAAVQHEQHRADELKKQMGSVHTSTKVSFDELLDCAIDTYKSAYDNMSLVAAGGVDAFREVGRQMRLGRLTEDDCGDDNPFIAVLVAERFGLIGAVEDVAADLEGLLFDPATGWPKVVASLFDEVKAYGKALCDCVNPVWAEAELGAAFVNVREWLVADWNVAALTSAKLLSDVAEGVTGIVKKLDTCPPLGASDHDVETIARLAGATPARARAIDQHFERTAATVAQTLDAVTGSPDATALRALVTSYAELAAFPVPLTFPLVTREQQPRYEAQDATGVGHAHPASIDRGARNQRWKERRMTSA